MVVSELFFSKVLASIQLITYLLSMSLIANTYIDAINSKKGYLEQAICKSRNGELGNGMRGMMGTQGIRVGERGIRVVTWRSKVGTREIGVGMRGMGVGMLGMRGMRGIRVGMRGIRVGMRGIKVGMRVYKILDRYFTRILLDKISFIIFVTLRKS